LAPAYLSGGDRGDRRPHPAERRGAALGLVAATWGVAAIVGPLVGGLFTHFLSWHWIFVANVPLSIVVIAMARTTMPVTAAKVRGPLDVPGIVLLALGLLGLMLGLTQYDVTGATSNLHARLWLTAGIVALIAFVFAERHAKERSSRRASLPTDNWRSCTASRC